MALVLCIDDDAMVAEMVADVVAQRGHEAVVETSSMEAISKWGREPRLRVVITDYLMPKMDGLDLLTVLRDTRPDVRRVLITAAPDEQAVRVALKDGTVQQLIKKPPNLKDIFMAVAWL